MFRGVNTLALDAKGRLAIPTRYRERLAEYCGNQMILTVDRDHCLLLYPLPDWEEIEAKLLRLPNLNRQARELQRLLVGHATDLELDGHGRILLPPPLRVVAGLDRRVVMIGQVNKFEIWNEDTWNERRDAWLNASDEDASSLSAELGQLSL